MRHLPLEPVPALLAQHRSAEAVLTNSQELFRAEFWHIPYLEIRLLLLVWEQTITHAFKAKPSCQVSVQSLTAIKSGEGSVALLSPPLQSLWITAVLPTNLPQLTVLSHYRACAPC